MVNTCTRTRPDCYDNSSTVCGTCNPSCNITCSQPFQTAPQTNRVVYTSSTGNYKPQKEEPKIVLPPSIFLMFPEKFTIAEKPLWKSQTYIQPKKKQFTSVFAIAVRRHGDFSRN